MNIYLLLTIAVIAFSSAIILEKKTLTYVDAELTIIFKGILYLLFGLFTFLFLKINNKAIIDKKYVNYKKGFHYFIVAYFIAFLIGNFLYYYTLKRTTEVTKLAFIIIVFNTITILGITYLFRGERINLMTFIGILIALIGVAITLIY